jgi:hypothetical protein
MRYRIFLFILSFGFAYVAVWYAIKDHPKGNLQALDVPQGRSFFRHFLIGLLALVIFDGVVFHSGLYNRVLAAGSQAGQINIRAEQELKNAASGFNVVAVLGDSRIVQGFSAKIADELGSKEGYKFVNLAVRGTYPRPWFYLLREVDPLATRYRAIVMPLKFDDVDPSGNFGEPEEEDILTTAPLLRYTDTLDFAASFRKWDRRCHACIVCLLRGTAFRADLCDLLEHPFNRVAELRARPQSLNRDYNYAGRITDVTGISYDAVTKQIRFSPSITPHQKSQIEKSVQFLQRQESNGEGSTEWTERIIARYAATRTPVILCRLPRGPLASEVRPMPEAPLPREKHLTAKGALILNSDIATSLETPEYFFDGYHLNAKGRRKLTERVAKEVMTHARLPKDHDEVSGNSR